MKGMDRATQLVIVNGLAADQWGLFTAQQAAEAGVNAVHLKRLVDADLLENVGRGVYRLPGAAVPEHLEIKVAWLRLDPKRLAWGRSAADPGWGVVSHGSACLVHGLGDIPAGEVEITVARRRGTRIPFVRLHTGPLEPSESTTVDGLPVTSVERTVLDLLHARADGGHIGGVIADAERRGLISTDALAPRVAAFAQAYGLPARSTGQALIDHLVTQAGTQLRSTEVENAVVREIATHEVVRDLAERLAPAMPDRPAVGIRASRDWLAALDAALQEASGASALEEQLARIAYLGRIPGLAALRDHTQRIAAITDLEDRLARMTDPGQIPALTALRDHTRRITAVTDLERSLHRLLSVASPEHQRLNDALTRLAQPVADAHLKRLRSTAAHPAPAQEPDTGRTSPGGRRVATGRGPALPAAPAPKEADSAGPDPESGTDRAPEGN
jgi:hypothetical protein